MADTTAVTLNQTTGTGEADVGRAGPSTDYLAFVLVPVFFLLGLLGVVICHVLKRKGYRCTTQPQEEECEEQRKDLEQGGDLNDTVSENNDTVGQIVHCIMRNEANSDALKAMLQDDEVDFDSPPLTPTSPGGPSPPMTPISPGAPSGTAKHTCSHLHTIGGPGGHNNNSVCSRCSQKKWPLMRPSARRAEQRQSHNEVTVLAVGRFRVTRCERPPRERRTLLVDSNVSAPTSPTEAEPKSRTASESQQEQTDNLDKEKR